MPQPQLPLFVSDADCPPLSRIGEGSIGGKAAGLALLQEQVLSKLDRQDLDEVHFALPRTIVLTTEVFDAFILDNALEPLIGAVEGERDEVEADRRLEQAFFEASFPARYQDELHRALEVLWGPLAVRSSSLLEDALERPFAGVYQTKLLPGDGGIEARLRQLIDAIKCVYASTFSVSAREYLRSLGRVPARRDKMAVVIQRLVCQQHGGHFYPPISATARSFNYYAAGHAQPEDGTANLALGLGKTIADGDRCWTYCPAYPQAPPPVADVDALLDSGQTRFWALRAREQQRQGADATAAMNPNEHLVRLDNAAAEADGVLHRLVSTYDAGADRLMPGLRPRGARLLDFAPLLHFEPSPFNAALKRLLQRAQEALGSAVELELACSWDPDDPELLELGVLQLRQMQVSTDEIEIDDSLLSEEGLLLASDSVMGNGVCDEIQHVLYVRPESFDAAATRTIAVEIAAENHKLLGAGHPYLLLGFGRWGSSDPWLGVPVQWSGIAGARAIVETTSPKMSPMLSQGSHFFHNMISFGVYYFSVQHKGDLPIDWAWLESLPAEAEGRYVRVVRTPRPLHLRVDGRTRRGVVRHDDQAIEGVETTLAGAGGRLIAALQERAKELNCLYEVEGLLSRSMDTGIDTVLRKVAEILPWGWQYPETCVAAVRFEGRSYSLGSWQPTRWRLTAPIEIGRDLLGQVEIYYLEERGEADNGPFLREEQRLLKTVAERLGHFLVFRRVRALREKAEATRSEETGPVEWREPLRLLRRADQHLYRRAARKMLHEVWRRGVEEAQELLSYAYPSHDGSDRGEVNEPERKTFFDRSVLLSERPFELAAKHMSSEEILSKVERWIQEDRVGSLLKVTDNQRATVQEIRDAIRRFRYQGVGDEQLQGSTQNGLRVALVRRLLVDSPPFVRTAKGFLGLSDFEALLEQVVLPTDSHGKLGGKASGLFLAQRIIEQGSADLQHGECGQIKVPRTWYLVTDAQMRFIEHNDLQDVLEQKYREVDEVRDQYPNIVQMFKQSSFPAEIVHGLSAVLDDLGEVPLVVRSSSLLEDSYGTAFSGKYKSLFLPNQGTKRERLAAILDAIAEIYASVFGPDPIAYRRERGLTDLHEEMGILIQEVVGRRVGRYFFPAFAGVAFSNNEFRWSPRLEREDGLVRLVPGLGTRAVDRVGDDYPVLLVPAKPQQRANSTIEEILRYAPRCLDALNLETRSFETIEIEAMVKEYGDELPWLDKVFSIYEPPDVLRRVSTLLCDPKRDKLIATFDGLIAKTPFLEQLREILELLEHALDTPVDIEFACDGEALYLLQCRPQSYAAESAPAPIPVDIAEDRVLFSANKHVSNGALPAVTHIVYVDPEGYGQLGSREEMLAVGRAVGQLNKVLPKRKFILMGPGRWGSRGDIKLGVSVTYVDICNTSMLVEIARRKGSYVPDLSFGTHFFQDLVESQIRYLPLYPDEEAIVFHERFFTDSPNVLCEFAPEHRELEHVVRVIDVPATCDGDVLRVLLNAELGRALGVLSTPDDEILERTDRQRAPSLTQSEERHWRWRLRSAQRLSQALDRKRFGVVAVYVFGSTKNATAGPGSDVDLLIHTRNTPEQQRLLEHWLEGWSLSLGEENFLRTGYTIGALLDVHYITDEDIAKRSSYALRIGAVTDAARKLPSG